MNHQEEKTDLRSLEGKGAGVREFVYTAAHDLREPLRTIRTNSEMLAALYGGKNDAGAERHLRFIRQGVDRLESMIRDIAEYCYDETRELEPAAVDLSDALMDARKEIAEELKASEAVVTHDALPTVMGDLQALVSVFRVLLENACKFRGEAPVRIHVGAERRGPEWVISVRDNGAGFNPTYCDRVFKAFHKLNGSRYPGSGLGLTRALRLIQRHGGTMSAESTLGEGSVLRFTVRAAD